MEIVLYNKIMCVYHIHLYSLYSTSKFSPLNARVSDNVPAEQHTTIPSHSCLRGVYLTKAITVLSAVSLISLWYSLIYFSNYLHVRNVIISMFNKYHRHIEIRTVYVSLWRLENTFDSPYGGVLCPVHRFLLSFVRSKYRAHILVWVSVDMIENILFWSYVLGWCFKCKTINEFIVTTRWQNR